MYKSEAISIKEIVEMKAAVVALGFKPYSEASEENLEIYREVYRLVQRRGVYQDLLNMFLENAREMEGFSIKLFDENLSKLEKGLRNSVSNNHFH